LTISIHQVESSQYSKKGEAQQIPNFLVLAKPTQPINIHSEIKLNVIMHKVSSEQKTLNALIIRSLEKT
jgi:hypothetical protein